MREGGARLTLSKYRRRLALRSRANLAPHVILEAWDDLRHKPASMREVAALLKRLTRRRTRADWGCGAGMTLGTSPHPCERTHCG